MSESSPAPVVEVRKAQISADYEHDKHGRIIWDSGKLLTQYHVIVDGRRVDSFLSRERAEREATARRAAGH